MTPLIFISAFGVGSLALATTTTSCVSSTFMVNSAADATALAVCSDLVGDVLIGPDVPPQVDLSGPTHLSGDLIHENNGATINLSSTSLTVITGALVLRNVTLLSTLAMPALTSIGSIQFESLPALTSLDLTSGITIADNILIADTFLASIEDINIIYANELSFTHNHRLRNLNLPVRNVTGNFTLRDNGTNMTVYLPGLAFVKHLNISHVTNLETPQLEIIEELAQFDTNHFSSLAAPIMQNCGDFIIANNMNLTNISLTALETVRGNLTITNNTMLEVIDGFKSLTTVDADMRVRGLLSEVEFPSLKNVEGNFEMSSTNDISDSCDVLKSLAPVSQCGTGDVHGTFACLSNNEDFDKNYCMNSSNPSNASIRAETGTRVLGLVLALFSALML